MDQALYIELVLALSKKLQELDSDHEALVLKTYGISSRPDELWGPRPSIIEWLMNNEVDVPKAFLPLLFKALTTKAPAGEQPAFTAEAKIRLCIEMHLRVHKENISHAKVFSETAEKYGVDPKTITRWWDEVNEILAPAPGFITLHRRSKSSPKQ